MSNNRQRVSIPILGLDTSTSDTQVKDGAMQELHNLRYSGGSWRDVKPFKAKYTGAQMKTRVLITIYDGTVSASEIVRSDVTVQATWADFDGEQTANTTATISIGSSSAPIEELYDQLVSVSIISDTSNELQQFYTDASNPPVAEPVQQHDYRIVYQHPDDADNYYIALETTDEGMLNLLRVDINQALLPVQIIAENIPTDFVLSHYGRILILGTKSKTITNFYYLYDGIYTQFYYLKPPTSRVMPMCYVEETSILNGNGEDPEYSWVKRLKTIDGTAGSSVFNIANVSERQAAQSAIEDDYFWGEICYFVAYRMRDGAIVCRSALDIIASELNNTSEELKIAAFGSTGQTYGNPLKICRNYLARDYSSTTNEDSYVRLVSMDQPEGDEQGSDTLPLTTNNFRICPLIKIKIDNERVNKNLIKEVCIYSTRVNPIWDIERLIEHGSFTNGEEYDFKRFYADNKLPEQPFYLVDSIPIDEFVNGELDYRLSADLLEDLEQKQAIDPPTSHLVLFGDALEYNERLHVVPAQELFEGFGKGLFIDDSKLIGSDYGVATTLSIGDDLYTVYVETGGVLLSDNSYNLKKILSYPDYRARQMFVATFENGQYVRSASYKLREAVAANYAYRCGADAGSIVEDVDFNNDPVKYRCTYVKYSNLHEYDSDEREPFTPSTYVKSGNVMRVSKANNPLSWPLAYSYAIGTKENRIIAINSGAIEMSDAKFGELQLFAFTEQGIFVLQPGNGEILYESTKPTLNYDKIINPRTLAVNYNVIYVASKGVYALYSNQAELLSAAINDRNNMPPIDFLSSAEMAYLPKYSEIVFYKENDPKAYTFSLESKTWSTRDWYYGKLIDSKQSVRYAIGGTTAIFDVSEEESLRESSDRIKMVSRPIKFGNLEFKRIETMVTRIQNDYENFRFNVELQASNDCVSWMTLRNTGVATKTNNILIRRTPFSAKYFRIILEGEVASDIAIDAFDFEYYLRFLHRLR